MYPKELIDSLEAELTEIGFVPLKTTTQVADRLGSSQQGTQLLFINSLCGCAGTGARAGTQAALMDSKHQPNERLTVFAGIDEEATTQAFEYTKPYPPSAPAIALFKDGELVHFIERHQIKGYPAEVVAENLQTALEEHCQEPVSASVA